MSDYPIHLFRVPGPYGIPPKSFAVNGAANEEEALILLDKGWHLTLEEARGATFDGDGKEGGSESPDGDKEALNAKREEYRKAFEKKPFPGWDMAKLQRRIDEKGK